MQTISTLFSLALLVLVTACGNSHDLVADAAADATTDTGRRDAGGQDGGGLDSGTDAPVLGWASCALSQECVVSPASCCGSCGVASVDDMVGVNSGQLSNQRDEACSGGDVACPACAAQEDPYLVATCAANTCQALDIRSEGLTACETTDDCVLSGSRGCCDCQEHTEQTAVAIHRDQAGTLSELICSSDVTCPPCAPGFRGLAALCEAGQCVVRTPRTDGGDI